MRHIGCIERDAVFGCGRRVDDIEEMQAVAHAVLVAGNLDVEHTGRKVARAEGHRERGARLDEPGIRLDPGIRLLELHALRKILAEEAEVVVEPHAVAGKAQRGDGVEKACRKAPQPAVAERGLGLAVLDLGK